MNVRVGVVGVGIGRSHVLSYQRLSSSFTVKALCDLNEARARDTAIACGVPNVLTNFDELCQRDDVDVIDLCTPSYLHFTQAQAALAAGKHVICEKPVAGSLREVDALILAEQQSGKRVMPIFQYRFGQGVQKLKWLIQEGIAGRAYLSTVETAWRRNADYYAAPWRGKWGTELGGATVTLAIHAHDLLLYVLGPVKQVFARMATLVNPIETEDCLSASLEMADGSLATLSVTTGSAAQISRHRFCFSNVTAESHTAPYTNTAEPWIFTGDSSDITTRINEAFTRFVPLPEGFAGQFERFRLAIEQQTELPVTLDDARRSLELITALYYSAHTGQPVSLPLTQDHPYYAGWRPSV